MNVYKIIRTLAKSNKYQTIYSNSKEGNLRLFQNIYNYTDNQILFLNYLNFYSGIYTDIALDYVDEIVLNNEIYEDAYLYYKRKSRGGDKKDKETIKPKSNKQSESSVVNNSTWVFKKPKKKPGK